LTIINNKLLMNTSQFGRYVYNTGGLSKVASVSKSVYDASGAISTGTFIAGAIAPEAAIVGTAIGVGYGVYKIGSNLKLW